MTTIVGIKKLNETVLMVDSCLNIGGMCEVAPLKLLTHDSPEGEVIPPFALACAGSLQATQEVFSGLIDALGKATIKPAHGGMDFAQIVARASRSILQGAGIALGQSQYLLALPGQLFAFTDAGDVHVPSRGYWASGSGEGFALGAMAANESRIINKLGRKPPHDKDAWDMCALALYAAADFDLYTKPPFHWARVFTRNQPAGKYIETGVIRE